MAAAWNGRRSLGATARRFAREEDGSATIWCLFWLLLFAGMAGLAIDSTNGFRNKTMLQATADVAALAGAMDIPNPDRKVAYDPDGYESSKNAALGFAHRNMGMNPEHFGSYLLDDGDGIQIGHWDFDADHYSAWTPGDATDPDDKPVNAVRVNLYQTAERDNGVATTMLRIAGFTQWEVSTTAIAALGYNHCYDQGFMSRKKVCQRTNSHWYPGFCIYGEEGLFLRPGNTWSEGSYAMLPEGGHDGVDQSNKDAGLSVEVVPAPLTIPMVDSIPAIAKELLSGDTFYAHPGFLQNAPVYKLETTTIGGNDHLADIGGWSGIQVADMAGFASVASFLGLSSSHKPHPGKGGGPSGGDGNPGGGTPGGGSGGAGGCQEGSSGGSDVAPLPADWTPGVNVNNLPRHSDSVLDKHRIYYHDSDSTLTISGTLQDVIIVTHGKVRMSNGAALEGVTVVSLDDAGNGSDAISMSHARLGREDPCEPGGEVRMYSMGSMGGASNVGFYGATLVSGGSIGFAAAADAMYGITAYAAGNISFTAGNTFGGQEDRGITDSGACEDATATPIPDDVWQAVLVH